VDIWSHISDIWRAKVLNQNSWLSSTLKNIFAARIDLRFSEYKVNYCLTPFYHDACCYRASSVYYIVVLITAVVSCVVVFVVVAAAVFLLTGLLLCYRQERCCIWCQSENVPLVCYYNRYNRSNKTSIRSIGTLTTYISFEYSNHTRWFKKILDKKIMAFLMLTIFDWAIIVRICPSALLNYISFHCGRYNKQNCVHNFLLQNFVLVTCLHFYYFHLPELPELVHPWLTDVTSQLMLTFWM